MCGRYATARTSSHLLDDFHATLTDAARHVVVDYNVAPTRAPLVVGRPAADAGRERLLVSAVWGLLPGWARDRSGAGRLINARVETVEEKPSFREAFARRRAVVPMDGYYEWWQPPDEGFGKPPRQPYFVTARTPDGGGRGIGVAGLYEFWRPPGEPSAPLLATFTILTTAAEGEDGRLHDRAPLLVPEEGLDDWLAPEPAPREELLGLLRPATPGRLNAWPVGPAVGNVRHNGPELVRPLAE
ncbi:MAG: SOS response-associated peptidase [Aeromicrobium sp.]|uniref:SOS response-associated peptidase n=1 Tax=Aeromicrobium sp. TaxID=1871063 RepID=UPI0039E2C5E0